MDLGMIRKVDIDREMQQSYLDYAMSVIVARALPDARDGLKPVQRRILYAMYDMGQRPDSPYRKSARIVGEVLGKYHPHGDLAVYEAMARLAQDFTMRYMLVDGQGNFGSVDGDPPAAMRYTEARLAAPAMDLLNQLDRNTVDFSANFDESLREPLVLPAAIPNLLVNGATGIAVGMATNIPPHNLSEVVDALVLMLQQWDKLDDISTQDLMRYIHGPDFPTGGIIIQNPQGDELTSAYGSGRGRVIVQARAHLEEMGRGRNRIIVTELPYMTNKSSLIERIAELVREGTLEGVADLRDESDRQGMRIVIEVSKTSEPEKVLRDLYRRTPMQTTFYFNMLALVNGEPHLLSLKHALRVYLDHRLLVVKRRSEFDLERARQRIHILEGLRIALSHLDEIIALIRNSPDVETARKRLIQRFRLSDLQAQAILDMQLRRLASLERKKIEDEYKELQKTIKDLEAMLKSPKRMRQVVVDELLAVKQAYNDRRRTQIVIAKEGVAVTEMLTTTDVTPAQSAWVKVMADGRISRSNEDVSPAAAGWDVPRWLLHTNTHHTLYLVTAQGRAAAVAVHILPELEIAGEGLPVYKVTPIPEGEPLAAIFSLPAHLEEQEERYVLTVTKQGLVKKTAARDLPGPSSQVFTLVKVNEGDELGWVRLTDGKTEVLLLTANGMAIRFKEDEVRPMGLVAAGVGGIKLGVGDVVAGAELALPGRELLMLATDGKAKRIPLAEFPHQGRYGQGVAAWKLPRGVQLAGATSGRPSKKVTINFEKAAGIQIRLDAAVLGNRGTAGKRLFEVAPGDRLIGMTIAGDALSMAADEPEEETRAAKSARHAGSIPALKPRPTTNGRKSATKTAASPPAKEKKAVEPSARQLSLLEGGAVSPPAQPANAKKVITSPTGQAPPAKKAATGPLGQPDTVKHPANATVKRASSTRKAPQLEAGQSVTAKKEAKTTKGQASTPKAATSPAPAGSRAVKKAAKPAMDALTATSPGASQTASAKKPVTPARRQALPAKKTTPSAAAQSAGVKKTAALPADQPGKVTKPTSSTGRQGTGSEKAVKSPIGKSTGVKKESRAVTISPAVSPKKPAKPAPGVPSKAKKATKPTAALKPDEKNATQPKARKPKPQAGGVKKV